MSPWLAHMGPDAAVLMLALGGLLICLEFNRPGTVVPVSAGTLLVLLASWRLGHLPVHLWAIALLFLSLALLTAVVRLQLHGLIALAGTILLITSLRYLVLSPAVQLWSALLAGTVFSSVTVLLGRIGEKARRAKMLPGLRAE